MEVTPCLHVCVRVCSLALLLSTHNGNLINIHKHTQTLTHTHAEKTNARPEGACGPSGAVAYEVGQWAGSVEKGGDFALNLQSD